MNDTTVYSSERGHGLGPSGSCASQAGPVAGLRFAVVVMLVVVAWVKPARSWEQIQAHEGGVTAIAISADGKLLATAGDDNVIKVWELATGALQRTLTGHQDKINSLAFSPTGEWLASAGDDKTVKIWEVASGKGLQTLSGHGSHVNSVAFSSDGKWVASGSSDHTTKIWDAANGQPVITLAGHTDSVTSVAFSRDGKLLATAGWDKLIKLWDVRTWKEQRKLVGHKDYVEISKQGRSGQMIILPAGFSAIAFSPDDQLLASVSNDRAVILWEVANGRKRRDVDPHITIMVNGRFVNRPPITSVMFSPDGKFLIVGGPAGLLIEDIKSDFFGWHKELEDATSVFTICPDGKLLVANADGAVTPYAPAVWQAQSWDQPSWSRD